VSLRVRIMSPTIHLNLHTHTAFSDGATSPEVLAQRLAAAGVRFAALTDHDTLEGQARFREALEARGVPTLPGLELTTQLDGRTAHLVAYGFDPSHPALVATLARMRHGRDIDYHSITASLRAAGRHRQVGLEEASVLDGADNGHPAIGDAIELIHRAGGRAFLAHPLALEPDIVKLEELVRELQALGLDGIEAIYDGFTSEQRVALTELARRHDLLVCAGTDYHGIDGLGSRALGIDMPQEEWLRFRTAVLDAPGLASDGPTDEVATDPDARSRDGAPVSRRSPPRSFALRVVIPAIAALGILLVGMWGLILPSFEQSLLDRKREMIQELTNAAWSVLATYHEEEQAGVLQREEAQAAAAEVIARLRYGPDRRDYFWIQDTEPRMVMHPYRSDLEDEDLSSFLDPRGHPIFVEFADVVEEQGEGYVDYVWQWFGDPERLEPKESFVKGFDPWDWVIGTGLYTDDVAMEIGRVERDLVLAAVGISGIIGVLLLLVLQQSLRIERLREEGVERLRDSNARYHALVEATTEGTLLVIDGRCRYANPTFLGMLGYTSRQLVFLELADVLPRDGDNVELWDALASGDTDAPVLGAARDGVLMRSDGRPLECLLTLEPVFFGGQAGHILLARDMAGISETVQADALGLGIPAGVFRALAARRGVFVGISPSGRALVAQFGIEDADRPALADCFADAAEFGRFMERLLDRGEVSGHILTLDGPAGPRAVLLSAAVVRDEEGEPAYVDGLLVDVTTVRDEAAGRDVAIEQLQASPLFLHESIGDRVKPAIVVDLDTSLGVAARRMTDGQVTAALVASGSGAVIGIVTDVDLRARAMAEGRTPDDPVHAVMTAPLIRIDGSARVFEALLRMEEHHVRHLAVADADGAILGVVDSDSLIQSPRYAPLVVMREIAGADSVEAVARARERALPLAASLMGSSARPRHVTSVLSSIYDAATVRLLELAVDQLGEPPVPFAFLAFGSQGRREVTLSVDQDNGLVYALPEDADADRATAYFERLGTLVCEGLAAAGYPHCRGKVMASDARWRRPLPDWLETYDRWRRRAEPQDITDLSIFLDFRIVHGDASLTDELRRHVHATLPDDRGMQYRLARNALDFRPPIRLPGNIYLGGAAEHAGRIDLKDALQPLVAFARVFAVRQRIGATHTLQRMLALVERDLLTSTNRAGVTDTYDFLMGLRLETQLAATRSGEAPTGIVELSRLSHTQQELLRAAYGEIAAIQKTAENEFPEP
jgi:PAS domain S-box-containing protein